MDATGDLAKKSTSKRNVSPRAMFVKRFLVLRDLSYSPRRVDFVAHVADDEVLSTGQAALFDVKAFRQPHKSTFGPIAPLGRSGDRRILYAFPSSIRSPHSLRNKPSISTSVSWGKQVQ